MMRVSNRWIGYCTPDFRKQLVDVVLTLDSHATLTISQSAAELRHDALTTPGAHAVVGVTGEDVSAVNLAAALVADGAALDVTLIVESASGSLKSRSATAGIADVIDLSQFSVAVRPWLDSVCADGSRELGRGRTAGRDLVNNSAGQKLADAVESHEGDSRFGVPGNRDEKTSLLGSGGCFEVTSVLGATGREPPVGAHRDERAECVNRKACTNQEARSQELAPDTSHASSPRIARGRAPIITFVSGRGGVGKTTLCATSACIAASWGLRVGVCDLDLSCGNLYAYLGLPHPADLSQLALDTVVSRERVSRLGVSCPGGVRLWGGCAKPEMAEMVSPLAGDVVCAVSGLCDLVLVDTSSTFTDAVAQAAQACDRLVITVDGGPGSAVAQSRLGALAVRLGVARTRIARLANKADPRGRDTMVINRADVGLETARSLRVVDGGIDVSEFMGAGQASALANTAEQFRDTTATCLAQLLSEMGRLPDCEDAKRALEPPKRRWRGFGRKREAI